MAFPFFLSLSRKLRIKSRLLKLGLAGRVTQHSVNLFLSLTSEAIAYASLKSQAVHFINERLVELNAGFQITEADLRWEFTAGLNACLNVMERLLQENVAVLREDLDKLQRLMKEFEAEGAALGARVDN